MEGVRSPAAQAQLVWEMCRATLPDSTARRVVGAGAAELVVLDTLEPFNCRTCPTMWSELRSASRPLTPRAATVEGWLSRARAAEKGVVRQDRVSLAALGGVSSCSTVSPAAPHRCGIAGIASPKQKNTTCKFVLQIKTAHPPCMLMVQYAHLSSGSAYRIVWC